jgi:preprotein translocase subunit SecA
MIRRLLNTGGARTRKLAQAVAGEVDQLRADMASLSDIELREAADRLRRSAGREGEGQLEAFALAAAAIERETGLVLRANQLTAAAVLASGRAAELATGEGKTLSALPAAFWLSLAGRGVHAVTANDYLAGRDAELAGRVLGRLGTTVGLVTSEETPDPAAKRAAYECDITYATANELGFDFLRDRIALSLSDQVQRPRYATIVDELDFTLIDEARTPLIISGPTTVNAALLNTAGRTAAALMAGDHYDVDPATRTVGLTDAGAERAAEITGADLSDISNVSVAAALRQALLAKELYRRDREYVVVDGHIFIVDEQTGRALAGRRWSGGLHQAVEWREGVDVQPENRTLASTTLQRYFGGYEILAGMTGTAMTAAGELNATYGLDVVAVPSHRPVVRVDRPDVMYATVADKLDAVAERVADEHRRGRPVLIGTSSVAESEQLSAVLEAINVPHQVLNAKEHSREAEIIAQAGNLGAVTVSTSMAGRGVDILLGGELGSDASSATSPGYDTVCALGGLCVIGTSRSTSRRVDDQLRGRAGRQGDPGETQFYLSLEDELLAPFVDRGLGWALRGGAIEHKAAARAIEKAQAKVESMQINERKELGDYDKVWSAQRETVWAMRERILGAADSAAMAELFQSDLDQTLAETDLDDTETAARWGLSDVGDLGEIAAAKWATLGEDAWWIARRTWLGVLDAEWVSHCEMLEDLDEGMWLRGTADGKPLHAWEKEAFALFSEFLVRVRRYRWRWWCLAKVEITVSTK